MGLVLSIDLTGSETTTTDIRTKKKTTAGVKFFEDGDDVVIISGTPTAVVALAKGTDRCVRINVNNPLAAKMKGWLRSGSWVRFPRESEPLIILKVKLSSN